MNEKDMKNWTRAHALIPLLVKAAQNGEAITYKEAALSIGMGNARNLHGSVLFKVEALCVIHGWPPLYLMVVKADTGEASGAWGRRYDHDKKRGMAWCFAWGKNSSYSEADLWRDMPGEAPQGRGELENGVRTDRVPQSVREAGYQQPVDR